MSAAREEAFGEGAELEDLERPAPEEVPADEEATASRGRFGRIALLVAVVGVEGAWLALLGYGAWQLIGLIP